MEFLKKKSFEFYRAEILYKIEKYVNLIFRLFSSMLIEFSIQL